MTNATKKLRGRVGRAGIALFFALFVAGCTSIQRPATEPLIAVTQPPPKQELRWTNGTLPKSFDPARAAAAPETDIVSAIFEGLTEIDPQTLDAKPATAEKWTASEDLKTWTFQLRKDARWSNGKRVVADDFVTSWKRFAALGDKVAHRELIQNIVGLRPAKPEDTGTTDFEHALPTPEHSATGAENALRLQNPQSQPGQHDQVHNEAGKDRKDAAKPVEPGVVSVDDLTLKVTLELPDRDFPKLVANPIFLPIYGDGREFETDPLDQGVVTNGAFRITSAGKDGVVLARSDTYWNKAAVKLDTVRFVPKDTAEAALNAYKSGELDAVTNVDFEPLALKLLTPYDDFRQRVYGALNFYEFNTAHTPYNDRRVREALAVAIDRDRLSDGQLEGSTQAANKFMPLGAKQAADLAFDVQKARDLLDKAGYPNGEGFPTIRLLVNRNDTQTRIARTVARMWKQSLNLETTVTVKESSELEAAKAAGDYDVIRRGVVIPTLDELAALTLVFGSPLRQVQASAALPNVEKSPAEEKVEKKGGPSEITDHASDEPPTVAGPRRLTEADAVYDVIAIPLYFPMSYSLVKPYVRGFDTADLGVSPLKSVSIDNGWQPGKS